MLTRSVIAIVISGLAALVGNNTAYGQSKHKLRHSQTKGVKISKLEIAPTAVFNVIESKDDEGKVKTTREVGFFFGTKPADQPDFMSGLPRRRAYDFNRHGENLIHKLSPLEGQENAAFFCTSNGDGTKNIVLDLVVPSKLHVGVIRVSQKTSWTEFDIGPNTNEARYDIFAELYEFANGKVLPAVVDLNPLAWRDPNQLRLALLNKELILPIPNGLPVTGKNNPQP